MKIQAQTWEEHVVYRNCFWHSEQFLYKTCSPNVLQKEEPLTKIAILCWLLFSRITVSILKRESLGSSLFKLQQQNLVFHIWFFITSWCNENRHHFYYLHAGPGSNLKSIVCQLWQYRLRSFQGRDTKLERCLAKNQL